MRIFPGFARRHVGHASPIGGMLVTRLAYLSYYSRVTKSHVLHVTTYFGHLKGTVYVYKTEPADRAARRDERRTHGSGLG